MRDRLGRENTLAREDLNDREFKDLRKKIREGLPEIPGVRLLFDEDVDQGGDSTYFAVNFFGQDTGVLTSLAEEAKRRIETIDGMADVSLSLGRPRREIEVRIDREKAARLGLTAEESRTFSASRSEGCGCRVSTPASARSRPGWRCGWRIARTSPISSSCVSVRSRVVR